MIVLVVNAGSSSLKYQLVDTESEVVWATGLVERIGEDESRSRTAAASGAVRSPTSSSRPARRPSPTTARRSRR